MNIIDSIFKFVNSIFKFINSIFNCKKTKKTKSIVTILKDEDRGAFGYIIGDSKWKK